MGASLKICDSRGMSGKSRCISGSQKRLVLLNEDQVFFSNQFAAVPECSGQCCDSIAAISFVGTMENDGNMEIMEAAIFAKCHDSP